jgi:hypothetical protein
MKADHLPIDQARAALGDIRCDLDYLTQDIEVARFMFERKDPASDQTKRERRAMIARHVRFLVDLMEQEEGDDLINGIGADLEALARWSSIRDQPAEKARELTEAVGGRNAMVKIYNDARAAFLSMFRTIAENAEGTRRRRAGPTRETTLIVEAAKMFDDRVRVHVDVHDKEPVGARRIPFIAAVLAHCGAEISPAAIRKTLERHCDK